MLIFWALGQIEYRYKFFFLLNERSNTKKQEKKQEHYGIKIIITTIMNIIFTCNNMFISFSQTYPKVVERNPVVRRHQPPQASVHMYVQMNDLHQAQPNIVNLKNDNLIIIVNFKWEPTFSAVCCASFLNSLLYTNQIQWMQCLTENSLNNIAYWVEESQKKTWIILNLCRDHHKNLVWSTNT